MINDEIKRYVEKSVLCWLATVNAQHEPNVSPKEMFTIYDDSTLLVAHIASPNTIQNIAINPKVCVSFLDVFAQKGFKIKGIAKIITTSDEDFIEKRQILTALFTDKFPIQAIIAIDVQQVDKIVAPSYFLYPETTEESQIQSAMKTYQVCPMVAE